jgi:hypothetical protein
VGIDADAKPDRVVRYTGRTVTIVSPGAGSQPRDRR